MAKYYVLDTNVILLYPNILYSLRDATVAIPDVVLEELDKFKVDKEKELGRNAREFARIMDQLHETNYFLENQNLKIIVPLYDGYEPKNDNKIVECAYKLKAMGYDTTLITNDTLMRIKARAKNIDTVPFNDSYDNKDEIYNGYSEIKVEGIWIDKLYKDKYLEGFMVDKLKTNPNMYIKLVDYLNPSKTAIIRITENGENAELVNLNNKTWGISGKNIKQNIFLDLLNNPNIHLVSCIGKAGSGKTLLALASALEQTSNKLYDKIVLTKPTVAASNEIGFLPGGMEEKMMPWMASYYDNLEILVGEERDLNNIGIDIEINALTYIRGRSMARQFIIIDEVQNLTKKEIKTIITRAGEGTKIILIGDIDQIDKQNLDSVNNALSYVINKFEGQEIYGHIKLDKTVRSLLADIASDIL